MTDPTDDHPGNTPDSTSSTSTRHEAHRDEDEHTSSGPDRAEAGRGSRSRDTDPDTDRGADRDTDRDAERDSDERDDGPRHSRRRGRHDHHGPRRRHARHGRKERVLHTRISEQLSDDIRRLAEDLRVPTSNLVRNVLEEVFTVVETVSDDVGDLLDDVFEEAGSARERVRRRSRHRGRHHGWRDRASSWADVAEAEIRRDEAAEAGGAGDARERSRDTAGRDADREHHRSRERDPDRESKNERARPPRPAFEEVIGWQPLVLNQTQDCAGCGRSIRRGSRAFMGQTETGLSRTALCRQCLADQ